MFIVDLALLTYWLLDGLSSFQKGLQSHIYYQIYVQTSEPGNSHN